MCGICGYLGREAAGPGERAAVRAMAEALTHRGPDAGGLHEDGPVVLGHRRLSIIDLSPEANQPLLNEDGTLAIVVNGEIYNHLELRRELVARGHRFRSRTDSEVVLHLYEEEGSGAIARLRGMFAVAIWDGRTRQLLLARDRVGKKPLYYACRGGELYFASELQALAPVLPWDPELSLEAIDQYLTLQYVPAPLTIYRGVAKLPAAHLLVVRPGEAPRVERYWRLSFRPGPPLSAGEEVERVRALIEDAVAVREMSDVPLGAFLSGGIDSSTVVAFLARRSSRPVKTFSIDLPRGDRGEAHYARLVAERYHTDHSELTVGPDMVSILPELVPRYGEPFADPSAVPTFYVSRLARQQVTVALSGDGGDEAFAGYTRYWLDRLNRLIGRVPAPARALLGAMAQRLPGGALRPARAFAAHLELPRAQRYLFLLAHFTHLDKAALAGPALRDLQGQDAVAADFERILAASDAEDAVNRLLDLDVQTYLPDDIFTKVDIASMAHALEVRAPLTDHLLLEWLASRPGAVKLRGFETKHLLRRVAADLLPAPILSRSKKGFGLPLGRWMRQELHPMARELLGDRTFVERGLFEPREVTRLLDEHRAGIDHGERLWNLLVLELWQRSRSTPGSRRSPACS